MPLWSKLIIFVAAMLAMIFWLATVWQQRSLAALVEAVRSQSVLSKPKVTNAQTLDDLPAPVLRYLNHVLPPDKRSIQLAIYTQIGSLRTTPKSERWMHFSAAQIIAPKAIAFTWDARVQVMPLLHVRVRDSYVSGLGAGQVTLLSAIPVGSASGNVEMNSGSLHRFLAEAVWYPTALLPSAVLHWDPVSDESAMATLTNGTVTVSLEFRFNSANEVVGIYTPGRWGSFDGGYKQIPWEGKFQDYEERDGVLVPTKGEVGWYVDGKWSAVWRGTVLHAVLK